MLNHRFPLRSLADELRDERNRLDVLDAGDHATNMRAVFSWSSQHLGTSAARMFRLMGLHPGPDISPAAAASLAGLPVDQIRGTLTELVRAHLINEHVPGRYTFHDLLRSYATEMTHIQDTDTERCAAVHRLLDHYLHTAHTAAELLSSRVERISLVQPRPGAAAGRLGTCADALAWFDAERAVLLAAVDHAAGAGCDVHAWQLAWTLKVYLDRRGHWLDSVLVQCAALAATRRLDDRQGESKIRRALGHTYAKLGRYDDAHAQLGRALDLCQETGDRVGQADTHGTLSVAWDLQGNAGEALTHVRQSLALYREAGHRGGQARSLNAVGWCYTRLGDHEQALVHCQQAVMLLQELGDRSQEAFTWHSLGYARHQLGQHRRAIDDLRRARSGSIGCPIGHSRLASEFAGRSGRSGTT